MNIIRKSRKVLPICLLLILTLLSTTVFAVEFPDVTKDGMYGWAYTYIQEMANKGIIKGYPDGKFLPGGSITYLEAMQLISGLRPLNAKEKSEAAAKYSDLMIELKVPTWATEAVITNIIHGVTSESELRNAAQMGLIENGTTKRIDRLTVTVSMSRAMGLENSTKQFASLIYQDTESITPRFRKHVASLVDAGVLNPQGRDGKFEPFAPIKRAEMAKMIKVAYDYLARNPVEAAVKEATIKGIIQTNAVTGENYSVTVKTGNDLKTFIVTSKTEINIDGRKSTPDQIIAGQQVEIAYDANTSRAVKVDISTEFKQVGEAAIILEAPNNKDELTLEVEENGAKKNLKLKLAPTASILDDGRVITKDKLAVGDRVLYQLTGNDISYINRLPKSTAVTGVLTELEVNKNKPSYIAVKNASGISQRIKVVNNAYIYRQSKLVELDMLRIGDQVAVKMEYGDAIEIDATSAQRTLKGSISGLSYRVNQSTEIYVELSNGSNEGPFVVGRNANIRINNSSVNQSELKMGMSGEFILDGKEVTDIYIDEARRDSRSILIEGKVVYVFGSTVDVEITYNDGNYKNGEKFIINNYNPRFGVLREGDFVSITGYVSGNEFVIEKVDRR
ncbi:MAG: S-layer homology domain-containing protein [Tissierellia bacterium]|nr:S-layer homology domain-containing protein [Tissierellia bacterium]